MRMNGRPVDSKTEKDGLRDFIIWLEELNDSQWSGKPLTLVAHGDNIVTLLNHLSSADMLEEFSRVIPHHIDFKSALGILSFCKFIK